MYSFVSETKQKPTMSGLKGKTFLNKTFHASTHTLDGDLF